MFNFWFLFCWKVTRTIAIHWKWIRPLKLAKHIPIDKCVSAYDAKQILDSSEPGEYKWNFICDSINKKKQTETKFKVIITTISYVYCAFLFAAARIVARKTDVKNYHQTPAKTIPIVVRKSDVLQWKSTIKFIKWKLYENENIAWNNKFLFYTNEN